MKHKQGELRKVDDPIYRYWQAIYLSFFSTRLYVDVFKRWKGWGFLYLILVMAILSLPLSLKLIYDFQQYYYKQIIMPLEKLPELYIQEGKVSIDEPVPYKIKNDKGEVIAIVDTSGGINDISKKNPKLSILITENKFIFRTPQPKIFFLPDVPSQGDQIYAKTLPKHATEVFDAKKWLQKSGVFIIQYLTQALVYPSVTLAFTAIYLALILPFSMIAQLIASTFLDLRLKYKQACRLLAVSATPKITLIFLVMGFNLNIPGSGLIYSIIWGGYFFYAVTCIKQEQKKMVHL